MFGKPEASHFFDGTNISSIFYWQWAEYVNTAVEYQFHGEVVQYHTKILMEQSLWEM